MNEKRCLKFFAVFLFLIVFSGTVLISCSRNDETAEAESKNMATVVSDSKNQDESGKNAENAETESDETEPLASTTVTSAEKVTGGQSTETTLPQTTQPATDSVENYRSDSEGSVTVKNTVVDRCLKIESIGESDGVLCVSVQNVSGQDLEYCVLKGKAGEDDLVFAFSVLPAGKSAVANEQNNTKYQSEANLSFLSVENRVNFDCKLSLHEDIFDVRCDGNSIEIRNKTPDDITGNIKICYKNLQDENLFTDKAYLVSADGLKSGETKQLFPKYFDAQSSRVIYIEYDK